MTTQRQKMMGMICKSLLHCICDLLAKFNYLNVHLIWVAIFIQGWLYYSSWRTPSSGVTSPQCLIPYTIPRCMYLCFWYFFIPLMTLSYGSRAGSGRNQKSRAQIKYLCVITNNFRRKWRFYPPYRIFYSAVTAKFLDTSKPGKFKTFSEHVSNSGTALKYVKSTLLE